MPGTMNLQPTDPDQIEAAGHEIKDRRAEIGENRRYYAGDMHKPLKVERDEADNNIIINLCADAVNQTVAFLCSDFPALEIGDVERETTEDERFIREMWAANGGATLLANIVLNGAMGGQAYVRVKAPDPELTGHPYPQIINLKPDYWVTWWNSDDYRRVLGYEARWPVADKRHSTHEPEQNRQVIVWRGDRWDVLDYHGKRKNWTLLAEDTWGFPLPPVVSVAHLPKPNRYYGEHELTHKRLNDAYNAVLSDVKSILHWHGSPTMFGTGFLAQQLEPTAVNGLYTVENDSADLKTVEMISDLGPAMTMAQTLESLFFRQSRVVVLPTDLNAFQRVTNLGIRAMFMPQIAKNEVLRRSYSKLIERVCKIGLMLTEREWNVPIRSTWGSALPVDETADVTRIAQEMGLGILSKRMAAEQRGYDWAQVQTDLVQEAMLDGVMVDGMSVGVSG